MSVLQSFLGGVQQRNAMEAFHSRGGSKSEVISGDDAMRSPMDVAAGALGLNEHDQKAALTDFLETGGQNLDPAIRAWCADFVNASLNKAGLEGTGSGAARSFLDWGTGIDDPRKGDIAVFSRGNEPWMGHVGFFDSYNPDGTIRVLGGNQGDAVSYANYSADRLLGFRRASTMDEYVRR